MINLVVFSKDRGCQLDLFLISLKRMFSGISPGNIHVLYTFSNEAFGSGYVKTIMLHPDVHFAFENKGCFKSDMLKLISMKKEFTIFFVDDIILKDKFDIGSPEVHHFLINEDIACLSLRLYPGINYCYTMNIPMTPPNFIGDKMIWDWHKACPGDWSYPMSLDGHLFRTKDIYSKLVQIEYSNPNTFEGNLANSPLPAPYMMCFTESKLLNIPANKVQDVNGNRHGNLTAYDINEQYIYGKRLSFDKLLKNKDVINNISCHQDIPLEWE